MSLQKNKYGLSRSIPEEIKKQVRINAGFSCIVCGDAFYQYEHVDPVFESAVEHNAEAITLLCGSCHDKVTRGYWSKEKIKNQMKNPYSKRSKYATGKFDFDAGIELVIGTNTFIDCYTILSVNNADLIKIFPAPSDEEFPPFYLDAFFYDSDGKLLLEVVRNEFKIRMNSSDIVFKRKKNPVIEMKNSENAILLRMILVPPKRPIVDELNMKIENARIKVKNNTVSLQSDLNSARMELDGCTVKGFRKAICLKEGKITMGMSS